MSRWRELRKRWKRRKNQVIVGVNKLRHATDKKSSLFKHRWIATSGNDGDSFPATLNEKGWWVNKNIGTFNSTSSGVAMSREAYLQKYKATDENNNNNNN